MQPRTKPHPVSQMTSRGHRGCHAVGFPDGGLINAWSCHIRIPSTPASCVAIFPIFGSCTSFRMPVCGICQAEALRKDPRIKVRWIQLVCHVFKGGAEAFFDRFIGASPPFFEFVGIKEVLNDEKSVFLIKINLFCGEFVVAFSTFSFSSSD